MKGVFQQVFEELLGGDDVFSFEETEKKPPLPKGVYRANDVDKNQVKTSSSHTHPAKQGNTKLEKHEKYKGSLGDVSDEGCIEHGDERYVLGDQIASNVSDVDKLKEYIVFSEIFGKPKCKK